MICPKCNGTRKIGIGPMSDCPDCVFPLALLENSITTLDWMIQTFDYINSELELSQDDSPQMAMARIVFKQLQEQRNKR